MEPTLKHAAVLDLENAFWAVAGSTTEYYTNRPNGLLLAHFSGYRDVSA